MPRWHLVALRKRGFDRVRDREHARLTSLYVIRERGGYCTMAPTHLPLLSYFSCRVAVVRFDVYSVFVTVAQTRVVALAWPKSMACPRTTDND